MSNHGHKKRKRTQKKKTHEMSQTLNVSKTFVGTISSYLGSQVYNKTLISGYISYHIISHHIISYHFISFHRQLYDHTLPVKIWDIKLSCLKICLPVQPFRKPN